MTNLIRHSQIQLSKMTSAAHSALVLAPLHKCVIPLKTTRPHTVGPHDLECLVLVGAGAAATASPGSLLEMKNLRLTESESVV